MDSSQQALQTDGKVFFKFTNDFQIIGRKPKYIQMNRKCEY